MKDFSELYIIICPAAGLDLQAGAFLCLHIYIYIDRYIDIYIYVAAEPSPVPMAPEIFQQPLW